MFARTGRPERAIGRTRDRRIARGSQARVVRSLVAALAVVALYAVTDGVVPAYAETPPTVTGVSPNTGPPAGGTTVTITGSGFAVGKSATRITFGETGEVETEAVGVNCTTTKECTATVPELPEEAEEEGRNPVYVTATVNNVVSAQTPANQFTYHGLWLVGDGGRLRGGEDFGGMRGEIRAGETEECNGLLVGEMVSNGQTTDDMRVSVGELPSCNTEEFSGILPFTFTLRLGDDGSATVEGGMEVRTYTGCVYEGEGLDGGFELSERGVPLDVRLSGTLTLVAEEEPGAECSATNTVSLFVGAERKSPEARLLGHTPPPPPAHWTSDGTPIKEGEVVPVALSSGGEERSVTLQLLGSTIACNVPIGARMSVTNPVGGSAGTDELTKLKLVLCHATPKLCLKKATEITVHNLPLLSTLSSGTPVRDVIAGVQLEVKCGTVVDDTFTGTLMPAVGSSVLEFGAGSGELEDGSGNKATVTGSVRLKGPQKDRQISAE